MGRFLRGLKSSEPVIDEFPLEPVELTEDEENYIENDAKAVEETYRKAIESLQSFSTIEDSKPVVQNELTDVEKKEWADRVAAMTDIERRFILTRFSTMDLYNELGARMDKDSKYIQDIKEVMNDYDKL